MNVADLRDALSALPDHSPVQVDLDIEIDISNDYTKGRGAGQIWLHLRRKYDIDDAKSGIAAEGGQALILTVTE